MRPFNDQTKASGVLILETYADIYADRLRELYPQLRLFPVASIGDICVELAEVDVLIAFGIAINEELMRNATQLKWIQSLATGVDHFLKSRYLRPETLLTSARGIHGPAMRETVAFLMLSLTHDIPLLVKNQMAHRWERRPWPLLAGKTAVVVGVGLSSIAIAKLLNSFGMRVIGTTRTPRPVEEFDEIKHTDRLAEFVGEADFLINILPGGSENESLIGAPIFAAMKRGAFFVNVGRGETVDENALIIALQEGQIAGAGLDVFRSEPLAVDSPLWDMTNVVACPHIGGLFREYEEYVLPLVTENMGLFLAGRFDDMRNLIPH